MIGWIIRIREDERIPQEPAMLMHVRHSGIGDEQGAWTYETRLLHPCTLEALQDAIEQAMDRYEKDLDYVAVHEG